MILVPSRRRLEHLKNFFKSAKETNTTSPGIVIVDTKDYLDNASEYTRLEVEHFPNNWRLYVSQAESMGGKVQELWHLYSSLEWTCLLNDDHYFITPEWDQKLIAQLDGQNFVTCNDGWKAGEANSLPAGATVWSGALLRAVGYIFPKGLNHTFVDNIWAHLGKSTGCWHIDMNVTVEHRHVNKGDAPVDETHKKMEGYFHTDGPIYLEWLRHESERAIAAIRRLQLGVSAL